jgi:hypothetical protein
MEGKMIGSVVSFWEYDRQGEMTLFTGVVLDEFRDPEERYARDSLAVRMDDGSVQTPYSDECRVLVDPADVDDDDGLERELQMEVDAGYEEGLAEQADRDEWQRMQEAA